MKYMKLGDILPDAGVNRIVALVNAGRRRASDFKPVLEEYRAHLLSHGVDADYLSYVLEYQVQHGLNLSADHN